jgi:hypothetical protein
VVVTLRKIVISAIIVFLNTINLRFQIYCIMLVTSPRLSTAHAVHYCSFDRVSPQVLGICFYATVSFRPFVTRQAHMMELVLVGCNRLLFVLSCFAGLFLCCCSPASAAS